ncbi:MAG: hypothetical protein IT381_07485 [Deltaproteobacteria bacterium]|nr:hypothetical protein [Deltaproteobacteria bacterium]
MTPTWQIFLYIIYMAVSIGLTVFLARTLQRNGAVFLRDVFNDKPELADALNQLLVVGFYLLNMGYACTIMRGYYTDNAVEGVALLVEKLGTLLISLGVVHFGNLYLFHRIRRKAKPNVLPLPVMPQVKIEHAA